jgi:UDP-N-acetylglucosamine--N-acetylmuramyl-(pentapeptide) pyrophosphoryl-undecaprenol N-acetylglucosamine transferase
MKYVLTGGGSGGHIYPLLSFAKVVRALDAQAEFLFVGKKSNMEADIAQQAGISFMPIATTGTKGIISWQNVKAAVLIGTGYLQAQRIIRDFAPDVCLGGGGYVSVPLMLAAARSRRPIVTAVLESDQFIGKANLRLAQQSDLIFGGLFDLKQAYFANNDDYYHVGHPRMQELYEAYGSEIEAKLRRVDNKHILFVGGSLGAERLNEQAIVLCAYLRAQHRSDITLTLITGKRYYDAFKMYEDEYEFLTVLAYSDEIAKQYLAADLLICRASAGVLAEATAMNLPFIAIPSPNVARNHQFYNGVYFVKREAGLMFKEEEIDGDNLATFIYTSLSDVHLLRRLKHELTKLMHKDAITKMYTLLKEKRQAQLTMQNKNKM